MANNPFGTVYHANPYGQPIVPKARGVKQTTPGRAQTTVGQVPAVIYYNPSGQAVRPFVARVYGVPT
jgi:hypothetical protein